LKRVSPHTPLQKLLGSYSRAGRSRHGSQKVFGKGSGGKPFFRKVSPGISDERNASTKIPDHTHLRLRGEKKVSELIKLRTKKEIIAALREHDIRLKKRLGQSFLIDHNLLDFIVRSACVGETDLALEIGAGTGLLTRHLAEAAGRVVAVEIDPELAELCREHTEGLDNVTLLVCNALVSKTALNPEIVRAVQGAATSGGPAALKAVSNLPYAGAAAVIEALLEGPLRPELVVCTVQKEVSDKLAAGPGSKDYGPPAVIAQAHARIEELRVLNPRVFFPEPKVSSAVVRLTPTDEMLRKIHNYGIFSEVVRSLFSHRRKKAVSALALAERFAMPREKLARALAGAGIGEEVRADALSVEQIVRLANELQELLTRS